MDQKPIKEFNTYAIAMFNYKLFERFKSLNENPMETGVGLWNLSELFNFIEANFAELHNRSNMLNILAILHNTMRLELSTIGSSSKKINIGIYVQALLNNYVDSEDDQRIIMQILFQLLKSTKEEEINVIDISPDVFHTLLELLFKCRKQLAANILSSLRIFMNTFKNYDQLDILWNKIMEVRKIPNMRNKISIILATLIPELLQNKADFYKNENLIKIVQELLASNMREERKCGVYLLKKIIPIIIIHAKSVCSWEIDQSEKLSSSWSAYVTIFENLEEKQSHLILPALENIKCICLSPIWLQLLYQQLLQHNNTLVLRWTIKYLLENFNCAELNQDLLENFLQAANSTNLYNYDNFCISNKKINNFLNCDLHKFLCLFGNINWKSVPLHFWLNTMDKNHLQSYKPSMDVLLKIAAKVRALQNRFIRSKTIQLFESKFNDQIKSLNIEEYLNLIETLYNVLDYFESYDMLLYVLKCKLNNKTEIKITKRMYEILSLTIEGKIGVQNALMNAITNIPPKDHGYLQLLVIFDFDRNEKQIEFCRNMYNIDLCAKKIQAEFDKMTFKPFVWMEKTVDYVNLDFKSFEMLPREKCFGDYMETGGWKTVKHFSKLLRDFQDLISIDTLDAFVRALAKYKRYSDYYSTVLINLLTYCKRQVSAETTNAFIDKLLNADIDGIKVFNAVFTLSVGYSNVIKIVDTLILPEPTIGDARIEERYAYEHRIKVSSFHIRKDAIEHFNELGDINATKNLFDYLLQLNNEVSEKKPRYFENSYEHRIKLRIAIAIMQISQVNQMLLPAKKAFEILEQNNQLNVTYLYERIFATRSYAFLDQILEYLAEVPKHSASQQVSIISICNAFCSINWECMKDTEKKKMLDMLLPLTMGANFQTRLYSQLVLYKLLQRSDSILIDSKTIVCTIRNVIGDQLDDLLQDIRLDINNENILHYDIVLYVTNAPFDELTFDSTVKREFEESYSKIKESFCRKYKPTLKTTNNENERTLNVQRKMNPDVDILGPEELISYPECKNEKNMEDNIIVIASLIDKLPNLGGIARTCEVLGIKNLVMKSAKYVNNIEFKTLSMSAENSLNISEVKPDDLLEFLIKKQIEGFEVVGAEQTAYSKTFVDFKLPKKCIILLGHEKEGIPSNLISILDHTVEIPQFGQVRSLNVHVTGALFMWEYCKQHIIQK